MRRDAWLDLVVDALAVSRIARLATVDEVPLVKRPRDEILRRYPPHGASLVHGRGWTIHQSEDDSVETGWTTRPDGKRITGMVGAGPGGVRVLYVDDRSGSPLGYLVQCPWCSSWEISLVVLALRRFVPRAWDPIARSFALSMVGGFLNSHA